jgi:3-phosphoshikimate 1-carboxyvinyltransferase
MNFKIFHPSGRLNGTVELPLSKSVINRMLIIQHLLGIPFEALKNEPNDTRLMARALECIRNQKGQNGIQEIYAGDAGTVFRFLTALLCFTPGEWRLTGTDRMYQRPILPLIAALQTEHAQIKFENGNSGPLIISGIRAPKKIAFEIKDTTSSQFATALLLLLPTFEEGIAIVVPKSLRSISYLKMTYAMLLGIGYQGEWKEHQENISIRMYGTPDLESSRIFKMSQELCWSSASFIYALSSLADQAEINLNQLSLESFQGDQESARIFHKFGIKTKTTDAGLQIDKSKWEIERMHLELEKLPDLVPAIVVLCAMKNVIISCSGIEHLKFKESNRIDALNSNLQQIGYSFVENNDHYVLEKIGEALAVPRIKSFNDHRIVMAFSLVALKQPVIIEDVEVVQKSFPEYWRQMRRLGFIIEKIA